MNKIAFALCPLGAHTSAQGGAYRALLEGKEIGATAIQMFTCNQKRWQGKALTEQDIAIWEKTRSETEIKHIMSHDSYLINLGCPDGENLDKSRAAFAQEIHRCNQLKIDYLNFHPGAALKESVEQCLDCIVESLLEMKKIVSQGNTKLLLETTAGQGSNVGYKFEHLAYIIDKVQADIPIGVCIDTCHVFAAGYDIRTEQGWNGVLEEFDHIVGLKYLSAFHVNDSIKDLGSRVDRHAPLGEGKIGIEAFRVLMAHPKLRHLPKYLETPGGTNLWPQEIALLRKLEQE